MNPQAPIGIFDSGFGGLTVARAVIDQLPYEDIVYLGDTARAPYGEQPIAEVREFALECLDHLVDQGVKMLVIACNSAARRCSATPGSATPVPVVEVILPAARRAVAATRTGRVGVICTEATATSQAYDDAFAAAPQVELHTAACPRFVAVRRGRDHRRAGAAGLRRGLPGAAAGGRHRHPDPGLHPLPAADRRISYVLGDEVTLVSSAEECAKEVYAVLTRRGLTHDRPRQRRPPVPDHRQPGGRSRASGTG